MYIGKYKQNADGLSDEGPSLKVPQFLKYNLQIFSTH